MKIIGLEFRVGMEGFRDIEACMIPLDIVYPFPFRYPHGAVANVTLHTSMGDANAVFNLRELLPPFHGTIDTDQVVKKYEELRSQIHRVNR